jgi:hypothetical protein
VAVEMILPRIIGLKSKNRQELEEGKVTMRAIVNTAGNRPDQFLGFWCNFSREGRLSLFQLGSIAVSGS